jgi:hypothetical protein
VSQRGHHCFERTRLHTSHHTLLIGPSSCSALAKLYSPDGSQPLYPLAFLTNGGGVTECFKAHQLSEWLGVNVQQSQVVLSHTPMRQLAAMYADQPVLVAGRGQVRGTALLALLGTWRACVDFSAVAPFSSRLAITACVCPDSCPSSPAVQAECMPC